MVHSGPMASPASVRTKHRPLAAVISAVWSCSGAGRSHASYKRAWAIGDDESDDPDGKGDGDHSDHNSDNDGEDAPRRKVKKWACRTVLEIHRELFQAMKVTGSTLKKRQKRYQATSATNRFRDLRRQNDWLFANVFDVSGNYLYCKLCIESVLGVNNKRLARLRKHKVEGGVQSTHKLAGTSNHAKPATVLNDFNSVVCGQ